MTKDEIKVLNTVIHLFPTELGEPEDKMEFRIRAGSVFPLDVLGRLANMVSDVQIFSDRMVVFVNRGDPECVKLGKASQDRRVDKQVAQYTKKSDVEGDKRAYAIARCLMIHLNCDGSFVETARGIRANIHEFVLLSELTNVKTGLEVYNPDVAVHVEKGALYVMI